MTKTIIGLLCSVVLLTCCALPNEGKSLPEKYFKDYFNKKSEAYAFNIRNPLFFDKFYIKDINSVKNKIIKVTQEQYTVGKDGRKSYSDSYVRDVMYKYYIFDSEDDINLQNFLDLAIDPLEETFKLKIEILESSRLLEKQSYAPVLNLSVQPKWQPENFNKIDSWNASVGINLSPMISGIVKQNKRKYQINRKDAEDSFSAYLQQ
jgi:hypothetical protein